MIKTIRCLLALSLLSGWVTLFAQTNDTLQYTDARKLTLIGKALADGPFFHRVDTAAFPEIPRSYGI